MRDEFHQRARRPQKVDISHEQLRDLSLESVT
jgi:hypothetical protein